MAKKKKTKTTAAKKKPAKKVAKKTTNKKVAAKKATSNKKKAAKKTTAKKALKKKPEKKTSAKKVAKKTSNKKVAPKKEAKKKVEKKVAEPKVKEVKKAAPAKATAPVKAKAKEVDTKDNQPVSEVKQITIQKDIVLTDAEGRILCRVRECDQPSVVESYCRYHYLLYWKKIQVRKKILSEGKLEKYIEELTSRYPNKYLDLIKRDLSTEADFLHAIQELEIDESSGDDDSRDFDDERSFIEEVRGVSDNQERDDSDY